MDWIVNFILGALSFLGKFTDWFKREVPLDFGFLSNDKIVDVLSISTGDPAKLITFRFRNESKITLTGVTLEIRIFRPLVLSPTGSAIRDIDSGRTKHGREKGNKYYYIIHSDLVIGGHYGIEKRVELNTQNITPGIYKVEILAFTTLQSYKYSRKRLSLNIS